MKLKFSFDVLLLSFALLIPMIGYLNYLFNGLVTSSILIVIYFIYLNLSNKLKFKKKDFKLDFNFLIIFFFVVFFNYMFVDANTKSKQYVIIFLYFIIIYLIDMNLNTDLQKKISIIFIIFLGLGIQALISIPYILNSDFLLIRNFSRGDLSEIQKLEAIKNGIGTNALYTSLSSLSIFGLIIVKKIKSRIAKILLILSCLAMIFSIFISTFFASIFLLIVTVLIYVGINFRKFINIKSICLLIVLILTCGYLYSSLLSDTRLLDPITKKIEKFQSNQQDVTGREALAEVSLNTFYDNPFLGIGIPEWRSYDKIGEHMPWVDFLANFGFLGFFPLLLFFITTVYFRFYKCDVFNDYNVICFIGVLIFIMSNFISPMITTPITFISFIFIFRSNSFRNA